MPRKPRSAQGGIAFHALNRGNCRMDIFEKAEDYLAFLKLLEEGRRRTGVAILAYCLMPNHWHMILLPRKAADLSDFFRWVCTTHVRRWRMHRHNNGEGHLYQGRFKSFPIQGDEHLLKVVQYVEANPLRAGLVKRAEDWRYSSLWGGERATASQVTLDEKILPRPRDWAKRVNESVAPEELARLQRSVNRGQPYGSDRWAQLAAKKMGLESTLRSPGRPSKIAVKRRKESL